MLIVDIEKTSLSRKLDPKWEHWWFSGDLIDIEERIPVVEERVSGMDGISDDINSLVAE